MPENSVAILPAAWNCDHPSMAILARKPQGREQRFVKGYYLGEPRHTQINVIDVGVETLLVELSKNSAAKALMVRPAQRLPFETGAV